MARLSQPALLGIALVNLVAGAMVIVVLWNVVQSLRAVDVPNVGEDLDRWGRVLSEEEKEHRRAAFEAPPEYWSCADTDPVYQKRDFIAWSDSRPIVPEVGQAVDEWLGGKETKLDKVITNGPTGAQYRLTGEKGTEGSWCQIQFAGNVTWD